MKKKLLLALSVCFFMTFTAAHADTKTYGLGGGYGYTSTKSGKVGLSYSQQNGYFRIAYVDGTETAVDVSQYTGIRFEYTDMVNVVKAKISYSEGNDEYKSLDDDITFTTTSGNVTEIVLYDDNSEGGTASVTLLAAYLVKTDGEEKIDYQGGTWCCTATYCTPEVSYNQNWGEIYILDPGTGDYASFTAGSGNVRHYTVTFSEATAGDLYVDLIYMDDSTEKSIRGYDITTGSTSYTFTIDDNVCTVTTESEGDDGEVTSTSTVYNVDRIAIKSKNDGWSSENLLTVKFSALTSYDDVRNFTLPRGEGLADTASLGNIYDTTYDSSTHIITFNDTFSGCGWNLLGADYSGYQGIEVAVRTRSDQQNQYIQLFVEYYRDEDWESAEDDKAVTVSSTARIIGASEGTGQTLYLDFDPTYASRIKQIYIQNGNEESGAQIEVVNVRLISPSVEGEAYTYDLCLSGYPTTHWAASGDDAYPEGSTSADDSIVVDDTTGLATLAFAGNWAGLGLSNWNSDGTEGDGKWNLASFDEVKVSYEILEGDGVTVQLATNVGKLDEPATRYNINQQGSDGEISLTIQYESYYNGQAIDASELDWTNVGQLVFQTSAPCTILIKSIEFVRHESTPSGSDASFNLNTEDAELPRIGLSSATYTITGDGTTNNHSIIFKPNSTGTYNIVLDGVSIGNTSASNVVSGLTIPAGVTVNLYIKGDCSISGYLYGINIAEGATLNIYMEEDKTLVSGTEGDDDAVYNTTDGTLTITAPYGIYCNGNNLAIYNDDTYNHTTNFGQVTVTSSYCGIYLGSGLNSFHVKGTNMTVKVTGSSGQEQPELLPYVTNVAGESYHPVCGIFNASSIQSDFSVGTFIIDAGDGEHTYGIYNDSGASYQTFYFGWGYFEITATQCVVHRCTQYSGHFGQNWDDGDTIVSLNGPFCVYVEGEGESWEYEWYCDGDQYGTYLPAGSSARYVVKDLVDYPYSSEISCGEAEYVNRNLVQGWNTLCLPFTYDTSKTSTEYDTVIEAYGLYTDCTEARDVITTYATFDKYDDTTDPENPVLKFTEYEPGNITLQKDVAYLVKVDSDVKVKFTVLNKKLEVVDDDYGDVFKTMYDAETMKGEQISGATGETVRDFKLSYTITYTYDDEGNVTGKTVENYFNGALDEITIPAYRAYISVAASDNVKSIGMQFDDGETTSIEELDGGADDGNDKVNVYGIDGKLVKVTTEKGATKGLSKGVYVVGGRKVVVM